MEQHKPNTHRVSFMRGTGDGSGRQSYRRVRELCVHLNHQGYNPPLIVGMVISILTHIGVLSMDVRKFYEPVGLLTVFESKTVSPDLSVTALGVNRPRGASMSLISFDDFRALIDPPDTATRSKNNSSLDDTAPSVIPDLADPSEKNVQRADEAVGRQAQAPSTSTPPTPTDSKAPVEDLSPQHDLETDRVQASSEAAPVWEGDEMPLKLQPYVHTVKPGSVLTIDGIKIKTVKPDMTLVTLLSVPQDAPVARIIFDPRTGRTMQVILEKATGDPSQIGPIIESLYLWRVSGKRLLQLTRPIEVKVELILADQ